MHKKNAFTTLLFLNLLCTFCPLFAHAYQYELSVCAIFQNEAPYLKEWIDHHKKNGVQHFWLYNNNSTDNYKTVLGPYIKAGVVELIDWPYASQDLKDWNDIQCNAYKDGLQRSKHVSKWCAFIDTDEFLFCATGKSIKRSLKAYKDYGGVVVNCIMYGTSNIDKILPSERMVDRLVHRSPLDHPLNLHVKSIVRPERVIACLNPHFFYYISHKFAVDENYQRVHGPISTKTSVNVFRINHYWSRDLDFFLNHKLPRQKRWYDATQQAMELETQFNAIYDPILINQMK